MTRPFIEFIQNQALPWAEGPYDGFRPGVSVRTLSHDLATGASSLIMRFPRGWAEDAVALDADEEMLVLDGELTVGSTIHGRYSFAHYPQGYRRPPLQTVAGATVLVFLSGSPNRRTHEDFDATRLVEQVDGFSGEWTGNFHPTFPAGAGRKFLRQDPISGEQTWLLGTMPLRWGERAEKHPVVEEMLLLAGELVGHVGTMRAGAYFWRPEEEWHGPFGSPTGNLLLFRTKGGPLSTIYEDEPTGFSWNQSHAPILPAELARYGSEEWQGGCACY